MSEPITPLTVAQTVLQEQQAAHDSRLMKSLVAIDQAANVIVFGGEPDETISANTALMARKHEVLGILTSKLLDLFQPDHGADAIAGDEERAAAEVARLNALGVINQ